jgi:hypothetical protein
MKVTIEHYVATNNPIQAQAVLDKYGVPKAKSMSDLVKKVHYVVLKHKDFAITDLSKIDTPYRRLILANIPMPKPTPAEPTESKISPLATETILAVEKTSGACGCSGIDGEQQSNCSGCGGTCGGKKSSANGEQQSNCSGCEHLKSQSGIDGSTTKTAAPKEAAAPKETKTADAPKEAAENKYMPLAILGVIVIAAIVVAKI